jgi:hypothetical protein
MNYLSKTSKTLFSLSVFLLGTVATIYLLSITYDAIQFVSSPKESSLTDGYSFLYFLTFAFLLSLVFMIKYLFKKRATK